MNLVDALKYDEFTGLTDSECVTSFNTDVTISTDNTAYTWSSLNLKLLDLGVDLSVVSTWDQVIGNMTGGSMMKEMLRATGIDFTLTPVRQMITAAIAASDNDSEKALLNALLQIGVTTGKKYVKYGLDSLPSEQEVNAARVKIQNTNDATALINECINPLIANQSSLADIKAAVAAWSN